MRPLQDFLHREAASGVLLGIATFVAIVWANAAPASYGAIWGATLTVSIGDWGHTESIRHVVNDGLMALFFFVIGLEVKRELTTGELADRRVATLPLLAALGGMVVPAAIFLAFAAGDGERAQGWGIPMATDIAFALGVLALLGRRAPVALKVLLLGIAVIDDIGAVLVIAIFYSHGLEVAWLIAAGIGLLTVRTLRELQVRSYAPYIVLGLFVWLATYESGVHATIAGVALGLLTPSRPFLAGDAVSVAAIKTAHETADDDEDEDRDAAEWRRLAWLSREAISPLAQLEHALHPWTSLVVLPLFALANVGIPLNRVVIEAATTDVLAVAIAAGLVIGKPLGIVAGAAIAVRSGLGSLPRGVSWADVAGVGFLAGIGFTMSLFLTGLAFESALLQEVATVAVLGASLTAGVIGAVILGVRKPPPREVPVVPPKTVAR